MKSVTEFYVYINKTDAYTTPGSIGLDNLMAVAGEGGGDPHLLRTRPRLGRVAGMNLRGVGLACDGGKMLGGGAPTDDSRCGNSVSGRRPCSRSPASTRPSRSCSRRCASAFKTCSTCPASSS